jgi:hypothetical protein
MQGIPKQLQPQRPPCTGRGCEEQLGSKAEVNAEHLGSVSVRTYVAEGCTRRRKNILSTESIYWDTETKMSASSQAKKGWRGFAERRVNQPGLTRLRLLQARLEG